MGKACRVVFVVVVAAVVVAVLPRAAGVAMDAFPGGAECRLVAREGGLFYSFPVAGGTTSPCLRRPCAEARVSHTNVCLGLQREIHRQPTLYAHAE